MYAEQFTPEQIRAFMVNTGLVDGNNGHIWDPMGIYEAAVENRVSARGIDSAMVGFSPGWEYGTAQAWIAANGLAPLLTDPPYTPPPVVSAPVGVVTPAPGPVTLPGPSGPPVYVPGSVISAPAPYTPRPPVQTVPGTPPPYQPGPAPAVPPITSAPAVPGTAPSPIPGTESGGGGALILAALAAAAVLL